MKTFLLATGALLLAAAAPAVAQDTATAPSPDGMSFTGPRAEFFGGWERTRTKTRFDDGVTVAHDHVNRDGAIVGALGGYDLPIGQRFVAGVFGSYALQTTEACTQGGPNLTGGCIKAGRELEGGARFGAKALNDKALLYVKGAYVNSRLNADFGSQPSGDTFGGHKNMTGWRAGAGAEYALNRHFYTKIEYDYTKFNSFNADDLGLGTDTRLRQDRNQVLGGFGIRF